MIDSNTIHNAGMIPALDTFSQELAEAASPHRLPIVAALRENVLTLRMGATALTLTLLHDIKQLDTESGLAAIDESLCKELDTFAAAYPQMQWLPVGRFSTHTNEGYMKSPHVCAVCDLSFLDADPAEWDTKCRQLRSLALGYAFAHVGIHSDNPSDCQSVTDALQRAFGFPAVISALRQPVSPVP